MKTRKWQVLIIVVLLLSLVGCAAKSMDSVSTQSNGSYNRFEMEAMDDYMVAETSAAMMESGSVNNAQMNTARKWIVTIRMRAETEDLDALLAHLNGRIQELGGYIESSDVYNGSAYSSYSRYRSASITVRVPAEKADAFTEQVSGASNVVSNNKTMEDITLNYVSVESRMKALQVEEARLLDLLAQAQTMSDLLEIESRLTDVRYELERVTSQLRVYDNQVDYATIYLDISEVTEYTVVEEQTVWQRIGSGFLDSLKGVGNFFVEIFVFLLANLPVLVLVAAVIWGIVFWIRRAARKRKAKRPPFVPPYYPPAPNQNPEQ